MMLVKRFLWCSSVIVIVGLSAPIVSAQTLVKGTIMDIDQDIPVYGVRVDLRTKEGLDPYDHRVSYSDANGKFELENVPDGNWRVRVIYSDAEYMERILMTPVFSAEGSVKEFHFKMNQEWNSYDEQVRYLRVRKTGEDRAGGHVTVTGLVEELKSQAPIVNARISLLEKVDATAINSTYKSVAEAFSSPSGAFEIPLLSPGRYLIDVQHSGFETSSRAPLWITSPTDIKVSMWKKGERPQVAGHVLDEHGRDLKNAIRTSSNVYASTLIGILVHNEEPVKDASIYLLNNEGQLPIGVEVGTSDATGVYRIENIDPGTYTLRVEAEEGVYEVEGVKLALGVNKFDIHY